MTQTGELRTLHRAVSELSAAVDSVRLRYGHSPAVARLLGDVERIELDASDLDVLTPSADAIASIEYIFDEPTVAANWADVDDEGVGGLHPGSAR